MSTPQPTDFQQFERLLSESGLRGNEKAEAWRLFKSAGMEAAQAYVTELNAKYPPPAAPIALREKQLPYKVWGK
jgi:hypothetical protein